MKKLVVALALATCATSVIAEPIPAFAMSCSDRTGPAEPLTLTWDGTKLEMKLLKGGPPTNWENPRASIRIMHEETGKDGKRITDYTVGFRAQEENIFVGTPRETKKERLVSVYFSEKMKNGFLFQTEVLGGVLVSASQRFISDCVSTLNP